MSPKMIQAWKSETGTLFETQQEAIKFDMKEKLRPFFSRPGKCYASGGLYPDEIIQRLLDNRQQIFLILNGQ